MKKIIELTPINWRKSFYNKCHIIDNWDLTYSLKSYNTIVATYDKLTDNMIVNGWYSNATWTHINAFLEYFWYEVATKKEMENWEKPLLTVVDLNF